MSEAPIVYGAFGEKPVRLDEERFDYRSTSFIIPAEGGFYPVYVCEKVPYVGPKEKLIEDIRTKIDSASHDKGIRDLEIVLDERALPEYRALHE